MSTKLRKGPHGELLTFYRGIPNQTQPLCFHKKSWSSKIWGWRENIKFREMNAPQLLVCSSRPGCGNNSPKYDSENWFAKGSSNFCLVCEWVCLCLMGKLFCFIPKDGWRNKWYLGAICWTFSDRIPECNVIFCKSSCLW